MVLSKINKKIHYLESKKINNNDLNYENELYELKIKSVPILITIGKQDNTYADENIAFFPIYLIKDNYKSVQIGIFEITSGNLLKHLDELDVDSFDAPLLYSFVTKEFLEKNRLNPRDSKKSEDVPEEVVIKESVKDKPITKNPLIQDIRKPFFSMISKDISGLSEETADIAKNIRKTFKDTSDKSWIQHFFKNQHYSTKDNEGGGDCFFYTIRDAFLSIGHETSVSKLREILVSNATEDQFHVYKNLYEDYSTHSNKLKIEAKSLKTEYEELQDRINAESDKTTKIMILKKGVEIKEKRNDVIKQYESIQPLIREVKFIANVPNFKHFKSKLRTSHYCGDSWSIGIIEKALNIKCIVLSSDNYFQGDIESVLNCSITTVSQLIDTNTESENFYEPDYYILLDNTNSHYRLLGYKEKEIFTFKELPFDLRKMIVNKCMEGDTIYNYIPDFVQMKTAKKKNYSPDRAQQLCDAKMYDLFDEHIEFVFHTKSRDGMPGKMNGEKIPDLEIKDFLLLNKIPNWRKKLSNDWIEPFTYDKHKWASVFHLYEASKYKSNPKEYIKFSLDSGSEMASSIEIAKGYKGKEDPEFKQNKNKILQDALNAKWSLPDLKFLLLETKRAKLSEFKRGSEPDPACILMNVRDRLKT